MSSGWETLNCANHPERLALERCEVCQKPLCAYCLYYTEDGQRLCAEHAAEARARGVEVEEPAAYSGQLVGAQAGALRKQKRDGNDEHLYKGNSNDLLSLLGLVIGLISLSACCGAVYCLPVVGLLFSLVALVNAKDSHDPKRTRKFGLLGLALSGVWVLLIAGCIAMYSFSLGPVFSSFTWWNFTPVAVTTMPYAAPTETPTPTAATDLSHAAAELAATPPSAPY